MDPVVAAQFRMKGRGEKISLANENRKLVAGGKRFDPGTGSSDAGGADKDHFEGATFKFGGGSKDGGVDLPAVGVALDRDVKGFEGLLYGVLDVFGEKDCAGAGAEGGRGLDEGLQSVEEVVALEKLEHGGGLASRHDEAVDAFEIGREADEFWGRAESTEGFGVGFVCALECKDAYGNGSGHRESFNRG